MTPLAGQMGVAKRIADRERPDDRPGKAEVHVRLIGDVRWRQLCKHLELTPRQGQVARLLCEGYPYKAIAQLTGVSINTIRMHMRVLFQKLGAHDRVGALLRIMVADRYLGGKAGRTPSD